ncbi:MAG: HAMP domain-containing histidine kinase [Leptolyngbya sp. SIOISBB]|nr:HAMP domain-containing histidine kinase [Leptolyngbya sp. SIOISBB]
MSWFRRQSSKVWQLLDVNSIRFRLTAGVVLASALTIGGVAIWLNWQLQQTLLASQQAAVAELSQRFKEDVGLYEDMMPTQAAVQKVIDHRAIGDTAIWVRTPDDTAFAQSETLSMGSWQTAGLTDVLRTLSPDPRLGLMTVGDRSLALCVSPLTIAGETLGTLYIVTDVTQERRTYLTMTRSLMMISGSAIVLLASLIAVYVGRSLQPVKGLSQQVMGVTAESLNATRLELDKTPTEVKELAHALDHTLERLAQSWEQQRRLVGDVSHELRTPLTLVQGYLQSTLRRCQTLTTVQRDGLETAASETDRTIQILNDLLVLARARMGHLQICAERLDLKQVVLDAVMTADPAGDRIEVDIKVAPLWIRGDTNALRQVLVNLIENALNYSPADTTVMVNVFQRANQAVIQICDHGRGIPLADQAEIFQPFYRVEVDRSRATGGTGLGLAIVKTLLTQMRGSVNVQSSPGVGSTFTIQLPLTQGE